MAGLQRGVSADFATSAMEGRADSPAPPGSAVLAPTAPRPLTGPVACSASATIRRPGRHAGRSGGARRQGPVGCPATEILGAPWPDAGAGQGTAGRRWHPRRRGRFGQDAGIAIGAQGNRRVPELVLDDLQVGPGGQGQGGRAVAQPAQGDRRQPGVRVQTTQQPGPAGVSAHRDPAAARSACNRAWWARSAAPAPAGAADCAAGLAEAGCLHRELAETPALRRARLNRKSDPNWARGSTRRSAAEPGLGRGQLVRLRPLGAGPSCRRDVRVRR